MADTNNATKIEVVGTCVRVAEPDPNSKFPKLEIWIEHEDGKYKNTIPFEAGAKYAEKFKPLPVEGDMVRCSGYVSGRPASSGERCYLSVRLAFCRVEGKAGRSSAHAPAPPPAHAPAVTEHPQSDEAPPPSDDGDQMPF